LFGLGDKFKPEGLIYVTLTVYLLITRSTSLRLTLTVTVPVVYTVTDSQTDN